MLRATPEAGHRLADRYRLQECIDKHNGTSTWRADDEKLCRPVGIHLMAADNELSGPVVEAAMAASTIDDGRFLRVLDAVRREDLAYVVYEWVPECRRLSEVLAAEGPMPPMDAQIMITDAAEALALAHAAGLAHLRLRPDTVLLSPSGQVKILGLCVEAALHGTAVPDPAAGDAKGLGRVLYAALTARWPEGEAFGLMAAPFEHGAICTPRQVRAGVPDGLDAVVDRVLNFHPRAGAPLRNPDEIVAALRQLPRPRPPSAPEVTGPMAAVTGILAPMPTKDGWKPSAATRGVQFAVAAMLVLGLVLLGWQIPRVLNPDEKPARRRRPAGHRPADRQDQHRPRLRPRTRRQRRRERRPGPARDRRQATHDLADRQLRHCQLRPPQAGRRPRRRPRQGDDRPPGAPAPARRHVRGGPRGRRGGDLASVRRRAPTSWPWPRTTPRPGETLRFAFATKTRYLLVWLVQLPRDTAGSGYRGGISEISVSG